MSRPHYFRKHTSYRFSKLLWPRLWNNTVGRSNKLKFNLTRKPKTRRNSELGRRTGKPYMQRKGRYERHVYSLFTTIGITMLRDDFLNICCVLVFYVFLCCSVCWFFVRTILSWCPLTWHIYIVYNILSLNISSIYIIPFLVTFIIWHNDIICEFALKCTTQDDQSVLSWTTLGNSMFTLHF